MEVGRRQILLDDTMSDYRNSGSNLRPSSQSKKMSIGIMIDALENKRCTSMKKGNLITSNTKKANSNQGDSLNGRTKEKSVDTGKEKETEAPEQAVSPWINTRSLHQKTKASSTTRTGKPSSRAQNETVTHSVQSFASHLNADGAKQQKFDSITYKRTRSKIRNSQKPEECNLGGSPTKDAVDANKNTPPEAPENVTSPWTDTRASYKKSTPFPNSSAQKTKPGPVQRATITHSVQSFSIPSHDDHSKQQKFGEITDKKMGGTVGNSQNPEEFTFVAANADLAPSKAVTEDEKERERTATLKQKLQDIFGTRNSPRSEPTFSKGRDVGINNVKLTQKEHHERGNSVKSTQNSDTIETDSENPDCTIIRPVTRSLTGKSVAAKVRPSRAKSGPSPGIKQKFHENSVFSFEEGLFEKGAAGNGCSASARKKGRRKNLGIQPRKIYFSKNNVENNIQRATCRSEMPPPAEKASSLKDKNRRFHGSSPHDSKGSELSNTNVKGNSHQSARETMVDQQRDSASPFVPGNENQQEMSGNQDVENVTAMQDESISPAFKINSPTLSSTPSSTPKSDPIEPRVYSPEAAEKEFTLENIYSWKNVRTSKVDLNASHPMADSSDTEEAQGDSPPCKPVLFEERKEGLKGLSESSSEDRDSKNSEEELNERDGFSPETAVPRRPGFMFHPSKRQRNCEGNNISQFSPTLPSPKGVDENDWTLEPSEQNQGTDLERIVTLFALALEKFRNKMKSATRKKSSEILMSVSEDIHLQLQNVQSQIQTDVGKLIKNGNSKRKFLETRFQEQQDKLKLIYDKFKEDIHHHLQDCKSTVEEFEMHHIELKGTIKKQKASHEKLASEVEEAIETQLNDADRRITALNKSAKKKMLELQKVIIECLKEDSL